MPLSASPGPAGRFAYLKVYLARYSAPFSAAVFFLSVEAACDLLQPTIMSRVIDRGVAGRDLGAVLSLGGLMLAVALAGALAATARSVIASRVSQRFGADLRLDLYRRVHGLSFTELDRFGTAPLVTRLTNDVTQLQNLANGLMRIFVKAPLLAIGGIVMAATLDPPLAVILAAVVPAVALLIAASLRASYPFYRRTQASLDRVNGVMREYLSGVRVVKAFAGFRREEARFDEANGELSSSMTAAMKVMAIFSPVITLTMNLGIGAVLWFGGARVLAPAGAPGHMGAGQVVAFVNYMTQILASLMMISFIFNVFVRARASAERIGEVMSGAAVAAPSARAKGARDAEAASEAPALPAAVRGLALAFEDVTFRYDGAREPALRGLGFSCPAGSMVGIIGSTGSGKSTLVSLVPRFYDPDTGRVLADGTDLRDLGIRELRSRIAMVPQRSLLFTGSILENIRWGNPDATEAEVLEAARAAAAHDFIAGFPGGYDSPLGRGGLSVSGGQRQRIAIARALVRKPALLILDDSTSAVDSVTEGLIRAGIASACPGATVLLVAQRVASVRPCDLILVLDEGRLAGSGRHDELVETCEVYRDICRSQLGGKEGLHGRA